MMLGKRSRPPIKRTTSLSEITFDLNGDVTSSDPFNTNNCQTQKPQLAAADRLLTASSPRVNGRRHSADFMETPQFLKACGLCKRRLVPGRDIYMYRGDSAFCSSECRQKQIDEIEKKENKYCAIASKKSGATNSSRSTKSETTTLTA